MTPGATRSLLLALATAAERGGHVVLLRRREVQAGRQVSQAVGQTLLEAFGQAAGPAERAQAWLAGAGRSLAAGSLGPRAARDLGGTPRVTAADGLLLAGLLAGRLGRRPPGRAHSGHGWHARDAAAEHRLHLLLALEEVRDQLRDLADGDAGPVGDARAPGAVDDLRVAALLRRHRPDDRLRPIQVTVIDLREQFPVLRRSRQHAEQVPDRPQLAHHRQLLDEILEREAL